MSEETFRWLITGGVVASWLALTATALAMVGIYRSTKKLEDKLGDVALKTEPVLEKAGPMIDSVNAMVAESRPKIAEVLTRANEITISAKDQVARLNQLVNEATDSARVQIGRIDMVVGDTVNRVEEATAAVESAVLRPVREVNAVVSGLRAAIGALSRGSRPSVDHVTQDEEMFI